MIVPGFRVAGVAAGIKKTGRPDVALLAADAPAACGAVFTQNRMRAAPVELSAARARAGRLSAVVVNSGNANACTPDGARDAAEMAARAAAALEVPEKSVAVASTGVIGVPLPMARVRRGVTAAAAALRPDGWDDFAQAILTTDKGPKVASARAGRAVVHGCAKGAGMIAPNLATTLAFVATDAAIAAPALRRLVRGAAQRTLNRAIVDGDTSTNDSLFVLASGRTAVAEARLAAALEEVLGHLAEALVRDGEGATHVVRVEVTGARSERAAERVARQIATSPLVKTAIAGADPNWGRVLAAAGNAGVPLAPARVALWLGDVAVVRAGVGVAGTEARAHAVLSQPRYTMRLDLGQGSARAHVLTCDLTHEYVTINASYRS
jgi:glutamate N-acetyltransferase/amino-acid N-acetyltransferase